MARRRAPPAMASTADTYFLDREKIVWQWPDAVDAPDRGIPHRWRSAAASRKRAFPTSSSFLPWARRRGCLSVAYRTNFGYIYFDKGRISYASIVNRRDRLGDLLVKNGLITQAQLDASITIAGAAARQATRRAARRAAGAHASSSCTSRSACRSGSGVFPVHLEPGDVQLRARRGPRRRGLPRVDQPGVAAPRGRAPRR